MGCFLLGMARQQGYRQISCWQNVLVNHITAILGIFPLGFLLQRGNILELEYNSSVITLKNLKTSPFIKSCITQGAQSGSLWWPGREGSSRGTGCMYNYGWFTQVYSETNTHKIRMSWGDRVFCSSVQSLNRVRLFATPWIAHARPPCPSPTAGVHPNSCPLSRWCLPAISSSVVPFSSCPHSLPVSGSFQMSQLFTSGGQSIGVSASASVLPVNTRDWSPLGWTGWISLQSRGLSGVFSNTTVQKHQFFGTQLSSQSNSHIYTWPLEKP